MARMMRAVTALGLVAVLAVAGAGTAQAASNGGTFNCKNSPLSGYVYSYTVGATVVTIQNYLGGGTIVRAYGSGSRTNNADQYASWAVTAPTIKSATGSCH